MFVEYRHLDGCNYIYLELCVGKNTVHIACSVKNKDVYFDIFLIEERQINVISSVCYYHIHNIARIKS